MPKFVSVALSMVAFAGAAAAVFAQQYVIAGALILGGVVFDILFLTALRAEHREAT